MGDWEMHLIYRQLCLTQCGAVALSCPFLLNALGVSMSADPSLVFPALECAL